ncbi:cell division protein ZapA [endosymbiont of Lamellibrachia barhami]|uniref:cell division protein ZapA n=1 Tax=endosymbiont of Lamellibrachia barhami TaxID=205975 RepID=UPI0015AC4C44
MSETQTPITVLILDKEYRVTCEPEERESLIDTARFLDDRMRDIRKAGRVIGTERIAVMAALNIAHELLEQRSSKSSDVQNISRRIQNLQEKIEIALNSSNQLEL